MWRGEEEEPDLELVDFIAQGLLLLFEPFFMIMHFTFRFVVCLLEHFQISLRLLQKASLILALCRDMVYDRSCGPPRQ